ncbi:MAG: hypothetical protein IH859_02835, partial [Chloroflexi bacterium]|nr:hypothetical protein [Chloroflexota bacterium]
MAAKKSTKDRYSFRVNPERDVELIQWLAREAKKRKVSVGTVIRDALIFRMTSGDPNTEMARALTILVGKLEASGDAPEQIAEESGLSADFLEHMA